MAIHERLREKIRQISAELRFEGGQSARGESAAKAGLDAEIVGAGGQHGHLFRAELQGSPDDQGNGYGPGVHHQDVLDAEQAEFAQRQDFIHRVNI